MYGDMTMTDLQSSRLVRLPLWAGLTRAQQDEGVEVLAVATS